MRCRQEPRSAATAAVVLAATAVALALAVAAAPRPVWAAHSASASGPVTISFPPPPARALSGRLHTLPALQCRLHPSRPGSASPDPDAEFTPYGQSGTGWVLEANAGAPKVVIPYGAGTCASPLTDAFQPEYLAALAEIHKAWFISASPIMMTGGVVRDEFEWAGNGFAARVASKR